MCFTKGMRVLLPALYPRKCPLMSGCGPSVSHLHFDGNNISSCPTQNLGSIWVIFYLRGWSGNCLCCWWWKSRKPLGDVCLGYRTLSQWIVEQPCKPLLPKFSCQDLPVVLKPMSRKKPGMLMVMILLNLGYKAWCPNHLRTFNCNLHAVDISRQFKKNMVPTCHMLLLHLKMQR